MRSCRLANQKYSAHPKIRLLYLEIRHNNGAWCRWWGRPPFPFHPTMKEVTKQKREKRNMGVSFRLAFVFSARVVTALFYFEIVYIPAGLVDDVVRWLAGKNKWKCNGRELRSKEFSRRARVFHQHPFHLPDTDYIPAHPPLPTVELVIQHGCVRQLHFVQLLCFVGKRKTMWVDLFWWANENDDVNAQPTMREEILEYCGDAEWRTNAGEKKE